jgi:UDP-N-acetylmuramoyl-L-alanyl-D-glutamate--2,6-diaminopimelate ligase
MPDLELATLLTDAHCQPDKPTGGKATVTGLTWDSRLVRPGYLYVALSGVNHNGNDFIDDAIKRGAVAVISELSPHAHVAIPMIQVPDGREALAALACSFFNHPSKALQTIGVTGTNGKTTVAFMVRRILEASGQRTGLLSTVHYEMGDRTIPATRTTPEAPAIASMMAQMVKEGCQAAVMEVSSHALVQKRTQGIEFDAAIFTNLTPEHLDYHGSMDAYFAAKRTLFQQTLERGKMGAAIINIDDRWGEQLAYEPEMDATRLTYGVHPDADIQASDVQMSVRGSRFHVSTPWGDCDVFLKLLGRFNISNALAAIAACGRLGVSPDVAEKALGAMVNVPGRLEEVHVSQPYQVFVDYAHTGDALANVLPALREISSGRLILVFGCGGDRDRSKRAVMGRVAAELSDFSFVTSDNPRDEDPATIVDEILEGFVDCENYEVVLDRHDAIASALEMADVGDIVLIAGKGHETFQEVRKQTIPFDDRRVIKSILGMD